MSKEEKCSIDLEVNGGTVRLEVPNSDKDKMLKLLKDPLFKGSILNNNTESNVTIMPSTDSDLNEFQHVWKDINTTPSVLSLFFDMHSSNIWKALNEEFDFDSRNVVRKGEMLLSDDGVVLENNRYFIHLADGLYCAFIEMDTGDVEDDIIISSLIFTYDSSIYGHDALTEKLLENFGKFIIVPEEAKDSNIYIANYTENGFSFDPYELGKVKVNLKGDKKKTYNDIVSNINKYKSGMYVLHGLRGVGKTEYLRMLLKNIDKKIIYVPVDSFEYALHGNSFFDMLGPYGDCLVIFEDCELYLKSSYDTNIYLSTMLKYNNSLISDNTSFNMLLVLNGHIGSMCSDLQNNDNISYISLKEENVKFKGFM